MTAARLADACTVVAAMGLSPGSSGNASLRDGSRVLVTPSGAALRELSPDSVSVLDLDGRHLDGPAPTKEAGMHLAVYRARPDAGCIVHLHSPAATALSCIAAPGEDPLPPYTPYRIRLLGRTLTVPYAPPGSEELAALVADASRGAHALLLANHGGLVAAADPASAVSVYEELETAAELTLRLQGTAARRLDPGTAWS
ncbi:class II aldolase/adducin family protein [Agromyces mediolanus]|uniref:class II aldolase/adducin family protein n=1 Tax=Agromyces mediolanus TaxID=41986 RepID=UPI002040B211|nr:class II aldolase/adducin family protein [Agromyces mediolanus]MCM3658258.1 class II aldolase/adducin family protein [Agromyces mediolanus]